MHPPKIRAFQQRDSWANARDVTLIYKACEKRKIEGTDAFTANDTRASDREASCSMYPFLEHFAPGNQRRRRPPARPIRTGLDLLSKTRGQQRRLQPQERPS